MKFDRLYFKTLTKLYSCVAFASILCLPIAEPSSKMKVGNPTLSLAGLNLNDENTNDKIIDSNLKINSENESGVKYKMPKKGFTSKDILEIKYKLDVYNYVCFVILCIVAGGMVAVLAFLIISFQREKSKTLL
jgi:hypothetical protein